MAVSTNAATKKPNYTVKDIEPIMEGAHVQARMFTLAPGDSIPWHHHSEVTDHYFVLRGTLSIKTRDPDSDRQLEVGDRYQIVPGTDHLLANGGAADCQFLLLQGGGKYDWIRSEK